MYTKNIRVTVNPAFDLNKLEELIASTDKRLKDIDSLVFDGWWFDGELAPYPKWYNSWQKKLGQLQNLRDYLDTADHELECLENTL